MSIKTYAIARILFDEFSLTDAVLTTDDILEIFEDFPSSDVNDRQKVVDYFVVKLLGTIGECDRDDLMEAIRARTWRIPSFPMYGNPDGTMTGYMCMTDFDHELGNASGGNMVYPSIEDLKNNRQCVDECGIIEVRLYATKIIQASNYEE